MLNQQWITSGWNHPHLISWCHQTYLMMVVGHKRLSAIPGSVATPSANDWINNSSLWTFHHLKNQVGDYIEIMWGCFNNAKRFPSEKYKPPCSTTNHTYQSSATRNGRPEWGKHFIKKIVSQMQWGLTLHQTTVACPASNFF